MADREEQLKESYETIQQAGGDHLVVVPAGDSLRARPRTSFSRLVYPCEIVSSAAVAFIR